LNFGTAITWYVWFCLVFVMMVVVGRAWRSMSPFSGFGERIQRPAARRRPVGRTALDREVVIEAAELPEVDRLWVAGEQRGAAPGGGRLREPQPAYRRSREPNRRRLRDLSGAGGNGTARFAGTRTAGGNGPPRHRDMGRGSGARRRGAAKAAMAAIERLPRLAGMPVGIFCTNFNPGGTLKTLQSVIEARDGQFIETAAFGRWRPVTPRSFAAGCSRSFRSVGPAR